MHPSKSAAFPDLAPLAVALGDALQTDGLMRALYATDASEYQETPLAVAFPRSEQEVGTIVRFAAANRIGLIPRGAGTSLAGQVVGGGIVVDLGRHLNKIIVCDPVARRVRVQPGVVRNELNRFLRPYGLFFAPETSTANRAMVGGMVGNNSCGANSIVYGSTREHIVSARGFLSDGSLVEFGPLTPQQFAGKCAGPDTLETRIYRATRNLLAQPANRTLIRDRFPKPEVTRRNTGYALDELMHCAVFDASCTQPFNYCRLLAGSEGTLFVGVEFELKLEPLPPPGAVMCAHFATVHESLRATQLAMRLRPHGCELIDRHILAATKANLHHALNRSFVQGDPGAVLVVEIRRDSREEISLQMRALESALREAALGYAYPVLWGNEMERVWELRRAGQGLVNNIPGDAQPREIVEDTAVAVADLPNYIAEFDELLRDKYGIECVYYAHAGAGELHTRPLFNLKTREGVRMFRAIATDVAALVKKYRGSLSGEHGDGRLRGEFIRLMLGDDCYRLLQQVKSAFDPFGVFNPGKIVDTPPMDTSLRHDSSRSVVEPETLFNFSATGGIVRATERCTGVGECRKSHLAGGTMCPSYMATLDESASTRARANILRQMLTRPRDPANPWNSPEIAAVLDLCISCKGCRSECPSSVDMARLKAEWQQHWYDTHGTPWRSRLIASYASAMRCASLLPSVFNWVVSAPDISRWIKSIAGFAPRRSLPILPPTTLRAWFRRHANPPGHTFARGRVHLFADEFTDTTDALVGIRTVELLNRLGYEVVLPPQVDSGRAHLSKGLVRQARKLAIRNVELLSGLVNAETPLVGIEPSALLGIRDEYPDLVPEPLRKGACGLAQNALLIDEFITREAEQGRIRSEQFQAAHRTIHLHGHCHQKALGTVSSTVRMLELPKGYRVEVIPSGCCGMAGSFGYEAEHFDLSQQIGELVLFPAVRATNTSDLIAAPGTSCRHQIFDGTSRRALHPVEILHAALL